MQFISSLNKLQHHHQQAVVTIGNFDGVHLGHQHLISALNLRANKHHKAAMVITFEPLPAEYFSPGHSLPRLTSLREKLRYFNQLQVDYVLRLNFNHCLANLPAQAFIDEVLIKRLNITHLIVGEDFHFGYQREGDITLLAQQNSFTVEVIKKITKENEWISSSRIRTALFHNDFELAKQLLGKNYTISGRVTYGQQLGRTLGFPTANINLFNFTYPIAGVFAVDVLDLGPKPLPGIANIGQKPTVNGVKKLLEVHIFDFDQSIYGQRIRIIPRKKIRNEQKFADLTELSAQITKDVKIAKQFFRNPHDCADYQPVN